MTIIILDLEWNQPVNGVCKEQNGIRLTGEIVQIGAVRLEADLSEAGRFSCYIKPQVYRKMNPRVKEVTLITDEMLSTGRPFEAAVAEFLAWCGPDAAFFTWSASDIAVLEDNMLFFGLDIGGLPDCYDVQLMFDDQISGKEYPSPLNYAIWKLGIKPSPAHDALNDSLNTAEILRHLDLSEDMDYYLV